MQPQSTARSMLCVLATAAGAVVSSAQPIPNYGHDFATIGAVGNAPYDANPSPLFPPPLAHMRGSVSYEYRISRTEITTGQWLQFVNSFSIKGAQWTHFAAPNFWGAQPDPAFSGPGRRWVLRSLPDAANLPAFGITWRDAARYANWLHNGQAPEEWAIQDGAYDTSTFQPDPAGGVLDQKTHHPGARFWIPTLDEMLKAQHYDPNRYGPGAGGWWEFSNSSDVAPVGGVPGVGQANTGFELPDFGHFDIPVGSYPDTATPWVLLDAAGGVEEWTEEFYIRVPAEERATKGSWAGSTWPRNRAIRPSVGVLFRSARCEVHQPRPANCVCCSRSVDDSPACAQPLVCRLETRNSRTKEEEMTHTRSILYASLAGLLLRQR